MIDVTPSQAAEAVSKTLCYLDDTELVEVAHQMLRARKLREQGQPERADRIQIACFYKYVLEKGGENGQP